MLEASEVYLAEREAATVTDKGLVRTGGGDQDEGEGDGRKKVDRKMEIREEEESMERTVSGKQTFYAHSYSIGGLTRGTGVWCNPYVTPANTS